ncbi:MAG: nucleoside recognition domain-containing protein [Pseudohongiellaceae bacterium]
MNGIFLGITLIAFLAAAFGEFTHVPAEGVTSPMAALSAGMLDSAADAVELALGLVGAMTLFLGLLKVAEAGGLLTILARVIRPLMTRLFPEVPPEHPAMGAMILNISATTLGLGNAATPFGIRAMQELDKLNPQPGTATNAMALFLAINTSGITLLPTTVIALRAAAGSVDPAAVLPTTLFATVCGTLAAIGSALYLQRLLPVGSSIGGAEHDASKDRSWLREQVEALYEGEPRADTAYPLWVSLLALVAMLALIPAMILWGGRVSPWIIPGLMVGFLVFGALRGVRIYEVFVEGAKDGFQVALRIIPFLVAILVAVGMFRSSGAMDVMVKLLGGATAALGLPAEALPMALLRPLSGSGSYGLMTSIINDPAIGPDSFVGNLVSTLAGSSETTFYVLAVYFGAVQIRRMRHTLAAALIADLVAVIAAVAICRYVFL